jgi:hypothetical protein
MSTIRINLHVKQAVSPCLYESLRQIKGRARAERIRALAECMLRIERGEAAHPAQRRSTGTTINAADFSKDDFAKSFGYET